MTTPGCLKVVWLEEGWFTVHQPAVFARMQSGCSARRNGNALSVIRFSARARAAEFVRAHAALPPCFSVETFTLEAARRDTSRVNDDSTLLRVNNSCKRNAEIVRYIRKLTAIREIHAR